MSMDVSMAKEGAVGAENGAKAVNEVQVGFLAEKMIRHGRRPANGTREVGRPWIEVLRSWKNDGRPPSVRENGGGRRGGGWRPGGGCGGHEREELAATVCTGRDTTAIGAGERWSGRWCMEGMRRLLVRGDRKSTRLNSSHAD